MTTWNTLVPDSRMVAALDGCAPRPADDESQIAKKVWSANFANQCAIMLASELEQLRAFRGCQVLPDEAGNRTEFVTASGVLGKGKKVDVSVSNLSAGLRLALTLKGGNFPDPRSGTYGKNLTGRLYELLDETRAVHEYHPHTPIICVYYFPIAAATDRPQHSTLARAVATIRGHTRRDDHLLASQFGRFDWAVIGLYEPSGASSIERGVVRYFDVFEAPPRVGRPKVETTMDTLAFCKRVAEIFRGEVATGIDYAEPEAD